MRILPLLAFLLLTACAPVAAPSSPPVAPPMPPPPSAGPDDVACAARGGTVRPVCRMQRPACVIAYEDAGKACTDGDQCEGRCVVLTGDGSKGGVCEADSDPCGCTTELIGGVPSSNCVD
jgi:hypothetical protein